MGPAMPNDADSPDALLPRALAGELGIRVGMTGREAVELLLAASTPETKERPGA